MDKKNDKRRQHYVPRFYLRNFSQNNKSVGLYLFKTNKMIKHGSINDNLWENYYYGEDAVVENKLAELEGRWNNIISSIIETEKLPNDKKELMWLRYFILISSARTLKCGNQMNDYYTTLMHKVLEVDNPELLEGVMNTDENRLSIKIKYPTLPFLNAAQQILPLVLDLKIDLLINRSPIDFITSDNPTLFYNQLFQEKKLSRGFGWAEYGIQFLIPICPKIAICMYDSDVYNLKERILSSIDTINILNRLFLNNSEDLIVFMSGGDAQSNEEKVKYIKNLVKNRETSPVQGETCSLLVFSNKQVVGKYNLSDVFEIKQKYMEMKISNHSKDEIEQKLNIEKEKLITKLLSMTDSERQKLLESNKCEIIGFSFNDMERPWVKFYNKYQSEIMAFFKF